MKNKRRYKNGARVPKMRKFIFSSEVHDEPKVGYHYKQYSSQQKNV